MKRICVITGASSGIGKEFFKEIVGDSRLSFDEIWVIARSEGKLKELSGLTEIPTRVIPLDLGKRESYDTFRALLEEERPRIGLLINCAGFGKFNSTLDVGYDETLGMIDLNVTGTVAMDMIALGYMQKGDGIINIASVAAYQPIPYINAYGASKAFVLNFTRALAREQKKNGIHVMAVCPYWTRTDFFDRAIDSERDKVVKKYVAMYEPSQIVSRALSDYKKGKEVSLFGFMTKLQLLAVKLAPTGLTMKIWMKQQKLK